jgi:hypothetical protein
MLVVNASMPTFLLVLAPSCLNMIGMQLCGTRLVQITSLLPASSELATHYTTIRLHHVYGVNSWQSCSSCSSQAVAPAHL